MPSLERRPCTLAEFQAGFEHRIIEDKLCINSVYSLWGRLAPGRYDGIVSPTILKSLRPSPEVASVQLISLGFFRNDMSIKFVLPASIGNGVIRLHEEVSGFPESRQLIQDCYLGEWEGDSVSDSELRSFIDLSQPAMT